MTSWVGAGLVALIACLAAGALKDEPLFTALVFTFFLLGGLSLAFARVQFKWQGTLIKQEIAVNTEKEKAEMLEDDWPQGPELLWVLSLILTGLGGVTMLIGIWWKYL